jgi:hypothetical protein
MNDGDDKKQDKKIVNVETTPSKPGNKTHKNTHAFKSRYFKVIKSKAKHTNKRTKRRRKGRSRKFFFF